MTIKVNIEHVKVDNEDKTLFVAISNHDDIAYPVQTKIHTLSPGAGGSFYVTKNQSINTFYDRRNIDRRGSRPAMPYAVTQVAHGG